MMDQPSSTAQTYSRRVLKLLLVAGATYVWVGFFFPDPYILGRGRLGAVLLWAMRLGIPLLVMATPWLYRAVAAGRVPRVAVALMLGSFCLAGILLYPIADYYYQRPFEQKFTDQFHPYLQVVPNEITLKPPEPETQPVLVVFMGGSTTEFADTQGKDWPSRVEDRLRAIHGLAGVRTVNAGRQWYTTLHTLIHYSTNVRHLKPDVLVVMLAMNDFMINADFSYFSHGRFRNDYGHFYGALNRLVTHKSLGWRLVDVTRGLWYHKPRQVIDTGEFPGLVAYERNLNTLIDLAQKDGTKVVLMTEPFLYKESMTERERSALYLLRFYTIGPDKEWSLATAKRGMERYNDAMKKIASRRRVFMIDLEKAIPKTLECFVDDVHYADKAFEPIGSYVAQELAKAKDDLFAVRPAPRGPDPGPTSQRQDGH